VLDNGYCFQHSPDHAEAAEEARHRGLVNGNKIKALKGCRPKLDDMPALVRYTARIIVDVVEQRVPADVGRVALYGLSIQKGLLEANDLE
jgi:hypothetical protein